MPKFKPVLPQPQAQAGEPTLFALPVSDLGILRLVYQRNLRATWGLTPVTIGAGTRETTVAALVYNGTFTNPPFMIGSVIDTGFILPGERPGVVAFNNVTGSQFDLVVTVFANVAANRSFHVAWVAVG